MNRAKCIQKFRDSNGRIYGYQIMFENGATCDMVAELLKKYIKSNYIKVVNLKLTSNERLVETRDEQVAQYVGA